MLFSALFHSFLQCHVNPGIPVYSRVFPVFPCIRGVPCIPGIPGIPCIPGIPGIPGCCTFGVSLLVCVPDPSKDGSGTSFVGPGSYHPIQHYLVNGFSRVFPCFPVYSRVFPCIPSHPGDPGSRGMDPGGGATPRDPSPRGPGRAPCTGTHGIHGNTREYTGIQAIPLHARPIEPRGPLGPGGGPTPGPNGPLGSTGRQRNPMAKPNRIRWGTRENTRKHEKTRDFMCFQSFSKKRHA